MNQMDSAHEMDAALDARLRAAFAPPRDMQRLARDVLEQAGVVRPVSRWRHLRAVAAILTLAAGLGWFALRDVSGPPARVSIDAGRLHAQIASVMGGPLACTSPEEANQLVTQCGGTHLDYRGGARVPLQGPLALPTDWPGDPAATVLGGHFEGRVVVVVIEGAELARGSGFEPAGELLVHRRELGSYLLREISSEPTPVCLDEFALGGIR